MTSTGFAAVPPCPSEESLSCFVEGKTEEAESERIRRHIDGCPRCRQVLVHSLRAAGEGSEVEPARTTWPQTFQVGDRIANRYAILRFIARGGMGEVYEALDTALQERVALKTITCWGLNEPHLIAQLTKEVRLARKVTHPNVCRILEFGQHEHQVGDGIEPVPFLTMELLSGVTLSRHLRRVGPLPVSAILPIAQQILEGLDAIHAAGIIHRDLKPDNVHLLENSQGALRVVVTDFGLAKSMETAGQRLGQSSDAYVVGTPEYMAPEQGNRGEPSPSWDIYAFGVVLFELASGSRPTKSQFNLRSLLKDSAPPRLLPASPDMPREFSRLVAWCLEKDAAKRCPRTGEIRRSLQRVQAELARGKSKRNALVAAAIALIVALTVAWLFRG
jgi:serine/threonine protein kinase